MVIRCLGVTVEDYFIPPFELGNGEYLILSAPYSLGSNIDKTIINCFHFPETNKVEKLHISKKFEIIKAVTNINKFSWDNIFGKFSIGRWLQKEFEISLQEAEKLLLVHNISTETNLKALGWNTKKTLAIQATLLKFQYVIFDTAGMDYSGIELLYKILPNYITNHTIVEIKYNSSGEDIFFHTGKHIQVLKKT